MLSIPSQFAEYTSIRAGDAGRAWIAALPSLVEERCAAWGLTIYGEPMHGGLSLVVPVMRGEEPCILKVAWIDESTRHEALALATWNGRGAVRLLEEEPAVGALLLERLDSQQSLMDVPLSVALSFAGRLLRRLAVSAPSGIPKLRVVAEQLAETFRERWERHGGLMPRRWLDAARDLTTQLGPSSGDLLVNYDLHYADVLAADREPWLAIDPKVVAGDPEYGLAQLLWRRHEEIMATGGLERHFRVLVKAAGANDALARSWTFVRCLDYCLWARSVGLTEDPERCERIMEWLAPDV